MLERYNGGGANYLFTRSFCGKMRLPQKEKATAAVPETPRCHDTERRYLSMQPHDTTPLKVCTKCGQAKPATAEYFDGCKTCKHGLRPDCKACRVEYQRAYREANKEQVAEYKRVWYETNRGRISEQKRARYWADVGRANEQRRISPEARKERRAEYQRAYREANRERIAEYQRAYREANRDRLRAYDRARYPARRENVLEYLRAYYEANKEKFRTAGHKWKLTNKERRVALDRAAVERRRARNLGAEGTYTAADVQAQYERQKGRCYWCGVRVGDTYHVDHVVPLSRGGSNWPENLVVACPTCNMSKGAKLPHEWPQGGRLL